MTTPYRRVSTLFQPNFGVFGIDLSGGGCWGLPMSNRYSHPSSKKCDFFRCKSRFSCVSAAFQLRFSCVSAHSKFFFWGFFFFGPKISAFLKVKLLVKLSFLCFSCVSAGKNAVLTLCFHQTIAFCKLDAVNRSRVPLPYCA